MFTKKVPQRVEEKKKASNVAYALRSVVLNEVRLDEHELQQLIECRITSGIWTADSRLHQCPVSGDRTTAIISFGGTSTVESIHISKTT